MFKHNIKLGIFIKCRAVPELNFNDIGQPTPRRMAGFCKLKRKDVHLQSNEIGKESLNVLNH
jgi:hypothetical protein